MLVRQYIDELYEKNDLEEEKLLYILDHIQEQEIAYLQKKALQTKEKYYGKKIYLRALIEFTNYCRRECRYCGINRYNQKVERYRLSEEEILRTCEKAKGLGFHTFVLQGGEDVYFQDELLVTLVKKIKKKYPDFALTLSVGERSRKSYRLLKEAGVDRFLLRHETIVPEIYKKLHPQSELQTRIECLEHLKDLGYQIGAGFMVGLPAYENRDYVKDLLFLKRLSPHMTGIGPFIPHHDTELGNEKAGSVEKTIIILALVRLLLPKVLLPATTALGTVSEDGRLRGFASGANVVMPNITPVEFREKYTLYNGKKNTGEEAAEGLRQTCDMIEKNGYEVDMGRGDSKVRY
ncbi:MAG: [FeFe] hydrogenase H-cluster radical SAM maturase HydE [Fusobacterium necrophorum]|nr:[FeFe] hydrogenase H-cluster radical SAM maturase HydE [Fusobacterium necrophorum]